MMGLEVLSLIGYASQSHTQATGTLEIGPGFSERQFKLRFVAIAKSKEIRTFADGFERKSLITSEPNGLLLDLGPVSGIIRVGLGPNPQLHRPDPATMILQVLTDAQIRFHLKEDVWTAVTSGVQMVSRLHALEMDRKLLDALLEYIL